MRKLVESTFMSLDGAIDNPQNWSPPYWDDEHAAYGQKLMSTADELLLGRKTYEGFAEAWPQRSGDPFTEKINAMPKHVATRTLTDLTWNAQPLQGDAVEAVAALKQRDGGDLLKYGTGEFTRTLLENGLLEIVVVDGAAEDVHERIHVTRRAPGRVQVDVEPHVGEQ